MDAHKSCCIIVDRFSFPAEEVFFDSRFRNCDPYWIGVSKTILPDIIACQDNSISSAFQHPLHLFCNKEVMPSFSIFQSFPKISPIFCCMAGVKDDDCSEALFTAGRSGHGWSDSFTGLSLPGVLAATNPVGCKASISCDPLCIDCVVDVLLRIHAERIYVCLVFPL